MANVIIEEELSSDELAFLLKKDADESRNFYKVISIFMVVCFIIPFVVAWVRAFGGAGNAFSYLQYFLGVAYLLSFLGLCAWLAFRHTLGKIRQDIKKRSKTIERAKIVRKQLVQHSNEYFFYLDSPNKLSIQVLEADYYLFDSGDEINIEYATNSKLYFGYF